MADGNALHVTRTKAFSAVEIQKTLERRLFAISFPVRSMKRERLEALFEVFQPLQTARIT
jgi:hypothetical protein